MTQVLSPSHEILRKIAKAGSTEPEEPVLLEGVSWELYEEFLEELDRNKRHLRVTYDEGRLEILTLGNRHEQNKKLLGRLVEMYGLEMDLDVTGTGSVTLKKPRRKGLEPDECYYIQTPPPGIDVGPLDLKQFPPPDLAIEVDISRSSIPRQPVYAFIAVPEVWRFNGERVLVLHRKNDGKYREAAHSLAFPKLSSADINRFLAMSSKLSQSAVVRAFRDWLRERR
jgi:Uma2 family endonuclease